VVKLRSSDRYVYWKKYWNHDGYDDCLYDVIVAQDGTIWAAGTSAGLASGSDKSILVARIEPDGSTLNCAYSGRADWGVTGVAIAEVFDTDGFCVAGTVESGILPREKDIVLAKFNHTPEFLWARAISADGLVNIYDEFGTDLVRTSDRGLALTGYCDDAYGGRSAVLVKLDPNATLDWAKIASGTASSQKDLTRVIETMSHDLATVGNRLGTTDPGVSLAKWSMSGTLHWNRTFTDLDYSQVAGLTEDVAGYLVPVAATLWLAERLVITACS
jgi:hypothetical protein